MISFELAKKLKHAGFPNPEEPETGHYDSWNLRDTFGDAYFVSSLSEITEIKVFPGMVYMRDYIFAPSLAQLLDACQFPPDIFAHEITLKKFPYGTRGYKYEAYVCCQRDLKTEVCDTAEEAMANLYLKINGK